MESRLANGLKLLYYKKPGPFEAGRVGARLPEAYRKFWNEWKIRKPEPVHYIPEPGKWKRDPVTGVVSPVQNIPIRVKYPVESHKGLWGGEGVIQGFTKKKPTVRRNPYFWVPQLKRSVVYSEILDKYMSVVVTERTINLIHKNCGFDHYILKTPACDLKSELAVRIKRQLLTALLKKDYYPDNSEKQKQIHEDYSHYLKSYTEEEIEWYGLTYREACRKLRKEDEAMSEPKPLKHQFRAELLAELLEETLVKDKNIPIESTESGGSWLSRVNPFAKKEDKPSA